MSNIANLKKYLKEQAALIRETKKELKECQRENSGRDGGLYSTLKKLSWDYRHHHIAYSMMRGKSYEFIEKPREENKPNMAFIQEIRNAYTAEDVCVGQI